MTFNLPNLRNTYTDIFSRKNGLDKMLDDFFSDFNRSSLLEKFSSSIIPKLNISEVDNAYHIEAELPGIKSEDVELRIEDNILTIKGKVEDSAGDNKKNYYMCERFHGSFQRSVALPNMVSENDINAIFKDGILRISIPKKEQNSAKKIEIKVE